MTGPQDQKQGILPKRRSQQLEIQAVCVLNPWEHFEGKRKRLPGVCGGAGRVKELE